MPVGELTWETGVTGEAVGRTVLRAIEGDADWLGQNAPGVEPVLLLPGRKDRDKNGMARAGRHGIEKRTDWMLTRARSDAKEGRCVIVSLPLLELTLGRHKRGRWHKKDAQGTSGSALSRVGTHLQRSQPP